VIRVAAVGDLHLGVDSGERVREEFADVAEHADLLLLAGDLTRLGVLEEAAVVADELGAVGIPTYAVLGNHDYQSGLELDIALLLEDAGIEVLEGRAATLDVDRQRVGIAGIKGFGCGFVGLCATEFGEPEMKAFVRHAEEAGALLAEALSSIDADIVISLTHYAPTDSTLDGEPLQIHPFLGAYQLGEAIDSDGRVTLAVHGHAHHGVEIGSTMRGVHVRNVARPVIRSAYRVYCLSAAGEVATSSAPTFERLLERTA
jgi:Icc-related predicted phosphoesterase